MAVYGDLFFDQAALNAAVAAFDQPSLRRGRFAAAQLWKLTSVGGRHLDLGELLAPFLGDVEAVIPYPLVQVFRHLDTFRMPTREHNGQVDVPVWPEEVRGMPVRYAVNVENGNELRRGRMMARATRRGHIDVFVEVRMDPLFSAAWTRRFRAQWPIVFANGEYSVHPALERLAEQTAATHFAIRTHNLDQRNRWLERRRQLAAQHGMRVDHRGRVVGADDSSDSE
jgi:hypothetical protein